MFGLGLERYLPEALYAGGIIAVLLSLFWRPAIGIYYLIPLIPMQTLRYRLIPFPMGESVVGIVLVSVVIGLLVRGQLRGPKAGVGVVLAVYAGYTLLSLFYGALYLGVSLPIWVTDPRLKEWQNYMMMPMLLVTTAAAIRTRFEIWIVLGLMAFSAFGMNNSLWSTLGNRDMSTYSEGLAEAGAMGQAGTNGLAAFEAQFAATLLVFVGKLRSFSVKAILLGLAGLTVACMLYSFSRGGYAAFLVGCIFLVLVSYKKLLVIPVVFLLFWTSLVPPAVRERVQMTYDGGGGSLDDSSETRLALWSDAFSMLKKSPVIGTGFYTYAFMGRMKAGAGHTYADTHNYFVKTFLEGGLVGLAIFLFLFWRMFKAGMNLYSRAPDDHLMAALGLGLAVWAVSSAVANMFGDRWSFLQVNGYMWLLTGLVCSAHMMLEQAGTDASALETPDETCAPETAITV
ncbi:MAG TPA: O-antigen ligase family protein [Bryobacteraceae bacterium]|nr:O-antigen ligase family protein [Bryobacteraceae bacterium]HPT26827.1 O-antigen ligase family protein [Bryobacteraceae bacterium]